MRTRQIITTSAACGRHSERAAVTHCDDCSMPLCASCIVDIPTVGTFCWDCASRRGGLHHGPHKVYAADDEAEEPGASAPEPLQADTGLGAQLFEAMVGDREPHPLISGLTERLEEAGADPQDVIDDAEVLEDIGRLQEMASAPHTRRGWRRRA